ncbi:proSAAS [Anomaloglossus baeobatrachus]|uniref:proSAAS n=1 Tax=Anomaloglossus baeobatrachus TaxID=238106 RepID=UPI003F4FC39A
MGPCILLVAVTVCLSVPGALSKPLGVLSHDDLGVARRVRRSLPYEADMMSYVPSEPVRNEPLYPDLSQAMLARLSAYPQEELLARALERMGSHRRIEPTHDSPSLQQLVEEGQRRDKEAMYLANVLHLWNQINQGKAYVDQLQGFPGPVPSDISDYQRPYPDYDDTAVVTSRTRPQISRNQMAQSHYRQNRAYEGPALHLQPEETNEDAYPMDEEMLRYLVTRVLSAMNEAEMSQRLPPSVPRRMRRSLDDDHDDEDTPANLLRVKRLDSDNAVPDYSSNGLLHRKRMESNLDIQSRPQHFTDQRVTEQLLKYFPE